MRCQNARKMLVNGEIAMQLESMSAMRVIGEAVELGRKEKW